MKHPPTVGQIKKELAAAAADVALAPLFAAPADFNFKMYAPLGSEDTPNNQTSPHPSSPTSQ